jgi:putative ABC transport system permease protein
MLGYHLRLALDSLKRTPGLTFLMLCAIAVGISTCIVTLTVYEGTSSDPIRWKSGQLYAVTIDSWDPNEAANPKRPDLAPTQLAYKDVKYLLTSDIPARKAAMFRTQDVISGGGAADAQPVPITTRVTGADFFPMFDVPFLYGTGWPAQLDKGAEPVIVISRELNEKLFGGANSVGRTVRWNNHDFRINGVLNTWFPLPKFYDLNRGAFDALEDAYVPFGWAEALGRFPNGGRVACWRNDPIGSFQQFLQSDCVWLQMWVQLNDAASRRRMQAYLDAYWADQHQSGRFGRPRNNRLTNVRQWLIDQEVVDNDNRMLVGVAFAFLAICLLNTVGMLLAKFLKSAPGVGIRRALGATRGQIFWQYLTEAALLAAAGAALGLVLGALGLQGVHSLYANGSIGPGGYQELTHVRWGSVLWALMLALLATLGAGFYPAWRLARLPPASYLKSEQ